MELQHEFQGNKGVKVIIDNIKHYQPDIIK